MPWNSLVPLDTQLSYRCKRAQALCTTIPVCARVDGGTREFGKKMNQEHKPQSPWASIWVHPRATIVRIVAENPNRSLWLLAAIYGFSSLLNMFQSISLGSALGPLPILIIAIIFAPIWGYIAFAFWSWMVSWTGKWFKGQGTFQTIRAAYAWASVPLIINIPLWLLMIFFFGGQLFLNFPEGYLLSDGQITLLFFILISKVILAVWSLVIYLNALSEVQNYSVLRAILNVIVAGLIVGIAFAILWVLLVFLAGTPPEQSKTAFQAWNDGTCLEVLRRAL